MMTLGRWIRAAQTVSPALVEAKFRAQALYRRVRRRPFNAEFRLLERLPLRPGEQILDVGANRGQSIQAIRMFLPEAPVVAFEPNALLAERLVRAHARDRALRVEACGLGSEERDMAFFVPFYNGCMFDGLASFERESAAGWLSPRRLAGFRPERLEIRETVARIRRLDGFGLAPGFVKIDVQGFEPEVVAGGMETIARHLPVLLVEFEPGQVLGPLGDLGYESYRMREGRLERAAERATNLFHIPPCRKEALAAAGVAFA